MCESSLNHRQYLSLTYKAWSPELNTVKYENTLYSGNSTAAFMDFIMRDSLWSILEVLVAGVRPSTVSFDEFWMSFLMFLLTLFNRLRGA